MMRKILKEKMMKKMMNEQEETKISFILSESVCVLLYPLIFEMLKLKKYVVVDKYAVIQNC